jgi:hypothetical protein
MGGWDRKGPKGVKNAQTWPRGKMRLALLTVLRRRARQRSFHSKKRDECVSLGRPVSSVTLNHLRGANIQIKRESEIRSTKQLCEPSTVPMQVSLTAPVSCRADPAA